MNKYVNKNNFIIIYILFYFILSFVGRFLYPIGDEPDFFLRSIKVIKNYDLYNDPINRFDIYRPARFLLKDITALSECKIYSNPLSFFAKIDYSTCSDNLKNIFIRFSVMFAYFAPVLFFILLNRNYFFFKKIGLNCSFKEWRLRIKIFTLSLLFPSIIFHLGFLSTEQISLFLSLLIFLFWGSPNLFALTIFIISLIDIGTGLIVLVYYFFIYSISFFSRYLLKVLYLFFIILLFFIFFRTYIINFIINYLPYVGKIFLYAEMNANAAGLLEKYPIYLRPVITYLSFIFLTPAKIKIITLYFIFTFFIFLFFIKIYKKINFIKYYKKKKFFNNDILILFSSIFFIICTVLIAPLYSLSKYFLFITPFILRSFLYIFQEKKIFFFLLFSNFIIFLNLIIYYL